MGAITNQLITENMKKRIAKKQIKKVIGYMSANGFPVVNCVSNPKYTGGTCVERDEDCYRIEVVYTRKRRGAPLLLTKRFSKIYHEVYDL